MQMIRAIIPYQAQSVVSLLAADILSLLPTPIRKKLLVQQSIVIRCLDEGFQLHVMQDGNSENLWSQEQGWSHSGAGDKLSALACNHFIDLTVPENRTLEQIIVLPRLAGENLEETVAFGLSTWTPFTPDEVFFAACPIATNGDQVTVSIKYALRSHIEPLIEAASRDIHPPDRLILGGGERWSVILNLKKRQRITWQKRLDAGLLASTFALALGLLLALDWRQEEDLAAYQNALRREAGLLAKESEARKILETTATRQSTVARMREENYSMSEVVVALARHLPPEASVLALEIATGKGMIEVTNTDSASLRESLLDVDPVADVRIVDAGPGQPVSVTFTTPRVKP